MLRLSRTALHGISRAGYRDFSAAAPAADGLNPAGGGVEEKLRAALAESIADGAGL